MRAQRGGSIPQQGEQFEAIGGEAEATPPSVRAGGGIRAGKLAGLSMGQAMWVLSWPILAEAFLNSTVGLVDTTLSSGISEAATDAVGGASYIMWLLSMVETAVSVGATALIARAMGKGRKAIANAAVGQSVVLAALAGVGVGAIVFALTPWVARLLNLSVEAATEFEIYLRITAVGTPFLAFMGAGAACCRGAGDAKRPLWTMLIVNVVNIVVSWAASGVDLTYAAHGAGGAIVARPLLHNPFSFDMGIAGIAMGTLVAWISGSAIIAFWLIRGTSGVRLRWIRMRPHWHTMRRIVRIGLPNMFETFGMWFGNFLVLLMVGWMGQPGLLGAHIVAIRIEAFSFLPGFSMGMAAATLVGQYIGAGRPDLARKALLRAAGFASLMMGCFGVLFLSVPARVVGVFTQQPVHLELAPRLIFIAGIVQIPFGIMLVFRSGLRGAGDTKVTMWLTWISTYLVRLPLAFWLSGVDIPLPQWAGGGVIHNPSPFHGGLVGLWVALCIELVLRCALFAGRFVQGGWQRIRV